MDLAALEAECWVDKCAVKRQMDAHALLAGADHNSFDAVGILKQTTDKKNKYYIYNRKRCQFVKKMSNVKKSNTQTMEEVHKKNKFT